MRRFRLAPRCSLLAAALFVSGVAQAVDTDAELREQLRQLAARVARLEARNAELETRLAARPAPEQALAARVEVLEADKKKLEAALASDRLSENEPEIATRLKATEAQSLAQQKQSRIIEGLAGLSGGLAFSAVAQRASNTELPPDTAASQVSYRLDATVNVPLSEIGNSENKLFAHLRLGQGDGLNTLPVYAKPNGTAFRLHGVSEPDDGVANLNQFWFQTLIPLPLGGFKPRSREHLEITFGKLDPFGFFDQNTVANDEGRQFLNTVFVHNALLDAGGEIGFDANGASPGLRVSYVNEQEKVEPYRLSFAVLGAGKGANFTHGFSAPTLIAQAETRRRLFGGLDGNYRLLLWRNGQAPETDGSAAPHSGLGINIDQKIADNITVFARYGHTLRGAPRFDRAVSAGADFGGAYWGRGGDVLGVGLSAQRTSSAFRALSSTLDLDGDGVPELGYTASGWERVAEVYYRYRLSKQIEFSPDLQLIQNPGGNAAQPATRIIGLRTQITY